MNKNMKILYDRFGDRDDFAIASFTIDPEHDTPSTLKKYADVWTRVRLGIFTGDKSLIYSSPEGFNIFASINPA